MYISISAGLGLDFEITFCWGKWFFALCLGVGSHYRELGVGTRQEMRPPLPWNE